ncbi:MAG: sugar ABC transporter permease [Candidatus Limiplasma sp.]|nr:sugar ABC transporter permease [Candidatus Limiplasma sp.]
MNQKRREGAFYLAILMPALLLLIVFFAIPVVQSLILSFTDSYGMKSSYNWVGFSNYVEALTDNSFRGTISTTFTYTLVAVLGSNLLALALALMLDNPLRGRNLLRAVFFIPNIMSLLVVGYVWRFVYTGALPDLLQSLGLQTVAVLGKPKTVIYALAAVGIWNCAGYYMVIYLSALQGISEDLLEAARIDGANAFHVLRDIKLPLLAPTIITCLILSVAAHMKTFEIPYTMTSGGPAGASMTMVLKIYNTAFNANRTGYATAQSTILFVLIAAISFILNGMMRKKEAKL